jgi:hypothetical protein
MKHSTRSKSGKAPAAISQPATDNQAQKQPSSEQIEKTLAALVNQEVHQFNCDLEIARRIYRSNPQLVKSPRYPEPWRTLFTEELGEAPGDQDTQEALSIAQMRRKLRPFAREIATDLVNKDGAAGAANAGTDIAESLRLTAFTEAQAILARMADRVSPVSAFDALLLRDILLTHESCSLVEAIEHVCGRRPSSNKAA